MESKKLPATVFLDGSQFVIFVKKKRIELIILCDLKVVVLYKNQRNEKESFILCQQKMACRRNKPWLW